MELEKLENWAIEHCPRIRLAHRIMNHIKGMHVARYQMTYDDVDAVETGTLDQDVVLKKYREKWPKYTVRFCEQAKDVLRQCSDPMFAKRFHELQTDMLFCRYAYGFMPEEYVAYRLYDKSTDEKRSYLSDRDRLKFIYKVNDMVAMDVVRNKNQTYRMFGSYYGRDALSITKDTDFDEFAAFVRKHPVFVQKNVRRNCGQGVNLVTFSSLNVSDQAYFQKLRNEDEFILEECIKQSTTMRKLHASSVNTVRCVTLITKTGPIVDHCFLKVGRNHSFLDNGAAGGLLVGIDLESGQLNTDGQTELLEVFSHHPQTQVCFQGYQLPEWSALLSLATELASQCPNVKFIGWDFAHTSQGWVLVEGNGRSQVIGPQLLYHKGYKKHFAKLMEVDFDE